MPKPEAGQFENKRKLFFVPTMLLPAELPEDGEELINRYWTEVRENIERLEHSLGTVSRVFHEALHAEGEEGLKLLEALNPWGATFIRALVQSDAQLEPTEDRELMQEASDWQRCISVGLMSEKVHTLASEGLEEATRKRYEHISERIGEALEPDKPAVLFLREDHRVQFPSDIQVFYVSPPALDALKRWFEDQMRAMAQQAAQQYQEDDGDEGSDEAAVEDENESA